MKEGQEKPSKEGAVAELPTKESKVGPWLLVLVSRGFLWALPPPWPSGRASASRVADLSSIPAFPVELFQV